MAAVEVVGPMAMSTRRSLAEMPGHKMRTIYFRSTTADYEGKAIVPGSETVNFHAFRESSGSRHPLTAPPGHARARKGGRAGTLPWQDASSRSRSALSAAPPSVCGAAASAASTSAPRGRGSTSSLAATAPGRSWKGLTTYDVDYHEPMDSGGGQLDRDSREHSANMGRAGVRAQAPARGSFKTCYGGLCDDVGRTVQGGLTAPCFETDNELRGVIGPGADLDGCPKLSFAGTQHRAPPKEAIVVSMPYPPQHNMGGVAQASDYFVSESRRNFTRPVRVSQAMQRTASAPTGLGMGAGKLGSLAEDLGPERVFRQKMMNTEYSQTIDHVASATAEWRKRRRRPVQRSKQGMAE